MSCLNKTNKLHFEYLDLLQIKREDKSSLFAPNLTMNLTYLCSGSVKVDFCPRSLIKNRLNAFNLDEILISNFIYIVK